MAKNATMTVSARIAAALEAAKKNDLFESLPKGKQAERIALATGIPVGKVKLVLSLDSEVSESEKITLADGTVIGARGRAPKGREEEAKAARLAAKATRTA